MGPFIKDVQRIEIMLQQKAVKYAPTIPKLIPLRRGNSYTIEVKILVTTR